MGTAAVESDGTIRQLDGRAEPEAVVTEADVQDAAKLARMVQALQRDVAALKRAWAPRVMYFRDVAVTATTTTVIRLTHGFGGRVNWSVVRWDASSAGVEVRIDEDSGTDADTLCLTSGAAGTVTIRVEEAGA